LALGVGGSMLPARDLIRPVHGSILLACDLILPVHELALAA
jgi:hypothetical protein